MNVILSCASKLPVRHITQIIEGKNRCTQETALALSDACMDMGLFIPHYAWRGGYVKELKALLGR